MSIEHDALGKGDKVNGKAKGGKWERKAAKKLTELTGKEFGRTPGSGALRWINMSAFCGDVTLKDQDLTFPFVVEVKAYEKLGILQKLKKGKRMRYDSAIVRFFDQAWEDAERGKKRPMLLVRENGMGKDQFLLFVLREDALGLPEPVVRFGHQGTELMGYDTDSLSSFLFQSFIRSVEQKERDHASK